MENVEKEFVGIKPFAMIGRQLTFIFVA